MRRPLRVAFLAALTALFLYATAGELLQAWVNLHFDAWNDQKRFGGEQRRQEWVRVQRALAVGERYWPWKRSLYREEARLHAFAARGRFTSDYEAGLAMLAAVQKAGQGVTPNGALLLLEAEAQILAGDPDALRGVIARLDTVAPNERNYQDSLLLRVARQSVLVPALAPVARERIAAMRRREPAHLEELAKESFILRTMIRNGA